jgi:Aspartyl protease
MPKINYFLITLLFAGHSVFAQQKLPIIKANSKVVDIRDGDDFQKSNWNISPEVRPDIFNAERFKGHKKVTFITDIDSISFDVEPQKTYDFIILLNNKDTAYTQFSTKTSKPLNYTSKQSNGVGKADTIPFKIGWNNSIRVQGKINNSDILDLFFDTGANGFVLSSDATSKNVNIKIDGDIQGFGLGGASNDKISKINKLEISGIKWDSLSILVKYQGKPSADGVIGYNVFDGKIVEIDYDKKIMVIHPTLPTTFNGYTKYPLKFKSGLSFIELTVDNGKTQTKGWFDFDAGSSSTLFLNNDFATKNEVYATLKKNGSDNIKGSGPNKVGIDNLILPKLLIGGIELTNITIDAESVNSKSGPPFNILGNDILKRFNTIIDYQNDVVYLKPNSLVGDMYLSQKIRIIKWSAAIIIVGLLLTGFIVYKKRKSRRVTK